MSSLLDRSYWWLTLSLVFALPSGLLTQPNLQITPAAIGLAIISAFCALYLLRYYNFLVFLALVATTSTGFVPRRRTNAHWNAVRSCCYPRPDARQFINVRGVLVLSESIKKVGQLAMLPSNSSLKVAPFSLIVRPHTWSPLFDTWLYCSYSKECESSLTPRKTERTLQIMAFRSPPLSSSIGTLRVFGSTTDTSTRN